MTERENFDKWVFSPKSNGYPLRNPHDALLAWEACAEQKQAEIDALRAIIETAKGDCSYRCIKCGFNYNAIGDNEDCPACGCDGALESDK